MGSAGLLQAMQKSFTIVQKQDQKLRRILKEKELRTKQFQQYKEDTKKAFAKQVQLYEADIQRLDAEYSTAMETGQVASAQVKALAVNGTPPPPARDPLQAEESWQALWHAVENAEPGLGFLQEAYDAVANSGMVRMAVHGNAAHLSSDSVTQTVRAMAVGPGPAQHVTGAAPLTRDPRQFQQPHFVATANAGASVGQVVSGPPGLGPPQYAPDGAAAFGAGAGQGGTHPGPPQSTHVPDGVSNGPYRFAPWTASSPTCGSRRIWTYGSMPLRPVHYIAILGERSFHYVAAPQAHTYQAATADAQYRPNWSLLSRQAGSAQSYSPVRAPSRHATAGPRWHSGIRGPGGLDGEQGSGPPGTHFQLGRRTGDPGERPEPHGVVALNRGRRESRFRHPCLVPWLVGPMSPVGQMALCSGDEGCDSSSSQISERQFWSVQWEDVQSCFQPAFTPPFLSLLLPSASSCHDAGAKGLGFLGLLSSGPTCTSSDPEGVCATYQCCTPFRSSTGPVHRVGLASRFPDFAVEAPKRRIGGSGTPAATLLGFDVLCICALVLDFGLSSLSFFMPLLLMLALGLLRLLCKPLALHKSPAGRVCLGALTWVPAQLVLPLGLQGLCWEPHRRKSIPRGICSWQDSRLKTFRQPRPSFRRGPPALRVPFLLLALLYPGGVIAMTTPRGAAEHEPPDALPGPSELLPTFVGNPEVRIPWLDAARDTSDDVVELPWDCRPPDPPGDGWLGIQVYSPFYRTVPFACSERRCRNTHQVVDAIRDFVGGVPHDLFPVLVPILPQRFTEYGGFIRSPRFTRHSDGSGLTAVIFDLSRVGGRYFADVVPGRMSYQEMIDHVYCYTAHCDHPLCFFVGCRQAAWPHGQPFQLQDGVAITVTSIPDFHNQASTFEDLLANKSLWGPVAQMPLLEPLHGTLVQHENERFFIAPYHQEGEGLPAAVARRIRRPLVDLTTCSFAIKDFDYKGYACDQILAVFNLPWPGSNRLQGKRRDIFTLCDGRALGMVPLVLHSAHPVIHLPSLAANLALRIPSAWCLDAVGGKRVEDEVFVGGHSTIMLYMHRESSDSEPDGEGPEISSDADSGESLHGQLDVANEYPVPPLAQPEHPPWRQRAVTVVTHAEATDTAAHHGSPSDQRLADATDLGGVVFAPHYQAEFFAIGVHAAEGLSEVVGRIKASALHLPLADLPGFVEVQPLPYTGFCAFVAFSEVVPANDNVAVVLDLSRVDGNIFAVVLPAKLDFDAWDPYVRALFPRPIQDYDLFNGVQAQPHAHGDPLYLQAGNLLVVCPRFASPSNRVTLTTLFSLRETWSGVDMLPRPPRSGICLLTDEDRWFLHPRHYPGCTLRQSIERCLGAPNGAVTYERARFGPIKDLCLHGEACRGVFFACRNPPPAEERQRDDCFVFLDFRPAGCRPFGVYQLGCCWQTKSLLDLFPFKLPSGFELTIEGGTQDGEHLRVTSGTTLVFRLQRGHAAVAPDEGHPIPVSEHHDPRGTVQHSTEPSGSQDDCRSGQRSRSPRRTSLPTTNSLCVLGGGGNAEPRRICKTSRGTGRLRICISKLKRAVVDPLLAKLTIHPENLLTSAPSAVAVNCGARPPAHGYYQCSLPFGTDKGVFIFGPSAPSRHKLLDEPTPGTHSGRLNLAVLRYLSARLGHGWRYTPGRSALFIRDDEDSETELDLGSPSNGPLLLVFHIVAPMFSPEIIEVMLHLPATVQEAIAAV